jgi:hypothetical protein
MRAFNALFRQQAVFVKEQNRAFWIKLSLVMRFRRQLRRMTGAEGVARKIRCYVRYSTMLHQAIHQAQLEYVKANSRKEAKSIQYLFAKAGRLENLFNALTGKAEERVELEIKSKLYRIYERETNFPVQAHKMVHETLQMCFMMHTAGEFRSKLGLFYEKIAFL